MTLRGDLEPMSKVKYLDLKSLNHWSYLNDP